MNQSACGQTSFASAFRPLPGQEGSENRIEVLPIKLDHILRIESLGVHHRDPFDRVLIAHRLEEKLPLISADPVFERYPVELIW
jgi:PIN domain nuclease of toxin-antitoxin system